MRFTNRGRYFGVDYLFYVYFYTGIIFGLSPNLFIFEKYTEEGKMA